MSACKDVSWTRVIPVVLWRKVVEVLTAEEFAAFQGIDRHCHIMSQSHYLSSPYIDFQRCTRLLSASACERDFSEDECKAVYRFVRTTPSPSASLSDVDTRELRRRLNEVLTFTRRLESDMEQSVLPTVSSLYPLTITSFFASTSPSLFSSTSSDLKSASTSDSNSASTSTTTTTIPVSTTSTSSSSSSSLSSSPPLLSYLLSSNDVANMNHVESAKKFERNIHGRIREWSRDMWSNVQDTSQLLRLATGLFRAASRLTKAVERNLHHLTTTTTTTDTTRCGWNVLSSRTIVTDVLVLGMDSRWSCPSVLIRSSRGNGPVLGPMTRSLALPSLASVPVHVTLVHPSPRCIRLTHLEGNLCCCVNVGTRNPIHPNRCPIWGHPLPKEEATTHSVAPQKEDEEEEDDEDDEDEDEDEEEEEKVKGDKGEKGKEEAKEYKDEDNEKEEEEDKSSVSSYDTREKNVKQREEERDDRLPPSTVDLSGMVSLRNGFTLQPWRQWTNLHTFCLDQSIEMSALISLPTTLLVLDLKGVWGWSFDSKAFTHLTRMHDLRRWRMDRAMSAVGDTASPQDGSRRIASNLRHLVHWRFPFDLFYEEEEEGEGDVKEDDEKEEEEKEKEEREEIVFPKLGYLDIRYEQFPLEYSVVPRMQWVNRHLSQLISLATLIWSKPTHAPHLRHLTFYRFDWPLPFPYPSSSPLPFSSSSSSTFFNKSAFFPQVQSLNLYFKPTLHLRPPPKEAKTRMSETEEEEDEKEAKEEEEKEEAKARSEVETRVGRARTFFSHFARLTCLRLTVYSQLFGMEIVSVWSRLGGILSTLVHFSVCVENAHEHRWAKETRGKMGEAVRVHVHAYEMTTWLRCLAIQHPQLVTLQLLYKSEYPPLSFLPFGVYIEEVGRLSHLKTLWLNVTKATRPALVRGLNAVKRTQTFPSLQKLVLLVSVDKHQAQRRGGHLDYFPRTHQPCGKEKNEKSDKEKHENPEKEESITWDSDDTLLHASPASDETVYLPWTHYNMSVPCCCDSYHPTETITSSGKDPWPIRTHIPHSWACPPPPLAPSLSSPLL